MCVHTQLSTIIGYGAPNKAGGHDVHGAPLGAEETMLARQAMGWEYKEFEVPQHVYDVYRKVMQAPAACCV